MNVEICFQPMERVSRPRKVERPVKRVVVPPGTLLLDAARRAGMPVASACGAAGLCARCGMNVLEGAEWVSAETPDEVEAKKANRIDPALRLSCMVTISGNVKITAPYW